MTGVEWIAKQRPGKPFIYVPGNHEFYSHDISLVEELKDCRHLSEYLAGPDVAEHAPVLFIEGRFAFPVRDGSTKLVGLVPVRNV
jgi:hypothetical protein